jgi:hypothetical protein
MRETCFCGRTDEVSNREPVLDADGKWALRCPECGHVDYLEWLSDKSQSPPLGRGETEGGTDICPGRDTPPESHRADVREP